MTDWVTSERKRQAERQSERQRGRGGDNSLILVKLQFLQPAALSLLTHLCQTSSVYPKGLMCCVIILQYDTFAVVQYVLCFPPQLPVCVCLTRHWFCPHTQNSVLRCCGVETLSLSLMILMSTQFSLDRMLPGPFPIFSSKFSLWICVIAIHPKSDSSPWKIKPRQDVNFQLSV